MKKAAIVLFMIHSIQSFSQNRFSKIVEFQPYVSQHVPINFDAINAAGAAMQARYDKNKEYRDNLIKWVFDLKTKTDDQLFLDAMDLNYKKLRSFDNEDFGQLGDELGVVKNNIEYEIDQCNTRLKEIPDKIWKSGSENLKNGYFAEAINDFSEYLKIKPDDISALGNRGYAYFNLRNYPMAIRDFDKFIEIKPSEAHAYDIRGWSKFYLKDYQGALSDFNNEIELDTYSADGYYNRGEAKSRLEDEAGAISDFTKAIELKSDYSMAYNDRGWSKFKLKKYNDALIDFNYAIILDSKNWVAYDSRQETKFALNNFKGCLEDCNSAISINSECANSYFFRGRVYYKQGNKSKACEDWIMAGKLGKMEAYEFISKYCK
jgi:tetratricopeptide (TPR) repeat protein